MKNKLLELVFDKARSEGASATRNGLATHISKKLEEDIGFSLTARALSNYHQKLEENKDQNISLEILDALAQYLDHANYKVFVSDKKKKSINTRRYKFVIVALLLSLGFFIYDFNRKKCMTWEKDHYEKIHCEEVNARPINPNLLANFKLINADCNTKYFDKNGDPLVWYYKVSNTEIEYFNRLTEHPINKKALKPITEYMIQKYSCNSFIKGN